MDSIIFDVDGTLWDSREPVREAWGAVIQGFTGKPWDISPEKLTSLFGQPMDAIARIIFPEESSPEAQMRKANACYEYENVYLSDHPGVLFPGVEDTLKRLSARYPLYIVSNCQNGYIEVFLSSTGLGHYFQDFLCFGDTHASKDVTIRTLMAAHGLEDAVYIGDTQGDADACQKAQVPFIYAAYGFGQVQSPPQSISQFSQLLPLFGIEED